MVLPIALNFFVGFNTRFLTPELGGGGLTDLLLGRGEPATTQPAEEVIAPEDLLQVPVLDTDPTDPPPGTSWVNSVDRRLCVQTEDGVWSTTLNKQRRPPAVRSEFGLRFYVSFVLTLALAFGIGSRELARNIMAGFHAKEAFAVGDRLQVRGHTGTLVSVGTVKASLETENGLVSLPNTVLIDEEVTLVPGGEAAP